MRTRKRQIKSIPRCGLTADQYQILFENQLGKCAVCKMPPDHQALAVDHNHDSGRIRGLLCRRCNLGLSFFKDDPASLRTAACYIEDDGVSKYAWYEKAIG